MGEVFAPERARRPAAVRFIFVTMLLDWLVVGIVSPVVPTLIVQFMGGKMDSASLISGSIGTAFAVMQLIASPILGLLSDRFGRRPVILISTAGAAVECLILALAPNVWWLFVGRVLTGITTASATASAAYIADVTTPEKRAAAFGLVGASFGVGFAVGPAVGGLLANFGLRVPFYAAAGLMIASTLYGLFVLPESLAPEARHKEFAWARANPLGSLKLVRRHRDLFGLVIALFCSNLAVQSFSVFVLFTIYRFTWSAVENGIGLGFFGAITVVAMTLVGKLIARFGARAVVVAGFGLGAIGFLVYGFAPTGVIFACALPLTGIWAIAGAPVQSAMSQHVTASEQGELQGAIGSMRSISQIIGPAFFSIVFALVSAKGIYPLVGAPWFFGALLLVGAMLFAVRSIGAKGAPAIEAGAVT
jgi:DHA1 family tetracycline resistance protein-like MFS transporter